ncbi:MAG: TetR/AcrR family transcriptional regulator [Sulfuricella sp.]|nr:TetR/AcrR family transcriptional regulator [Sulfuricella sp.]
MAKQAPRNMREEILDASVPLFAMYGFEGVSMRFIAAAVGVTPAALYYHFSDKEQIYLDVVRHAFEGRIGPLKPLLDGGGEPWGRLEAFVARLTHVLAKEEDFRRLMQWVMLDVDERRQQSLANCVFGDLFDALCKIAGELAPNQDAHLLVISMIALVVYPFETRPVGRFLPGYQRQQEDPEAITRHVVGLLRNGLGASDEGKSQQRPVQGIRAEQT